MFLCAIPALAIVSRLWSLQVDPNSHHLFKIRAEHAKLVRIPPRRAVVVDRNGEPLIKNRPVYNLHFVYRTLNPRYVVIEVACDELSKLGEFAGAREVELHLRSLVEDFRQTGEAPFSRDGEPELNLVEDIPASAARRIHRRLWRRDIYKNGFRLVRSSQSLVSATADSDDVKNALDEDEKDDVRYELRFQPRRVMRLEETLARVVSLLEPHGVAKARFQDLDEAVGRALSTIDRWVERFVRRDVEAGVEEAIWRSKARNARYAYYDESWKLVRDVGLEAVTQIEYHPELFPGIEVVDTTLREYPLGEAAGPLLGYLGQLDDRRLAVLEKEGRLLDLWTHVRSAEAFRVIREGGLRRTDSVGRSGLERFYDDRLRGLYGMRVVQVDSRMRERAVLASLTAEDGRRLKTTLDAGLQRLLYDAIEKRVRELRARGGSAVVLSVPDGEILAAVGYPAIDTNRLGDRDYLAEIDHRWKKKKPGGWIDRAYHHALDPGSIFKIVTAIAALESGHDWEGPVDPLRTFECTTGPNRPFRASCASTSGHGPLNLYESFEVSCNNYFYYLGTRHLDAKRFDYWSQAFGFGRSPRVDLPSRSGHYDSGYLRPHDEVRGERSLCLYSIGQSHVRATPMQVARLMAAVAVDCKFLPTPWLVDRAAPERLALRNPRTAKIIAESLRRVVSGNRGTVHGKSGLEEFRFAAKTATAQFADNGKRYHAWLAGYGPLPKPSMAFAIVIEDSPEYGGDSSAPVARALFDELAKRDPGFLVDPDSHSKYRTEHDE